MTAAVDRLPPEHQAALPDAMGRFVTGDLADIVAPD
jgi:hypothetical protein